MMLMLMEEGEQCNEVPLLTHFSLDCHFQSSSSSHRYRYRKLLAAVVCCVGWIRSSHISECFIIVIISTICGEISSM
jgi:hypothetical protein